MSDPLARFLGTALTGAIAGAAQATGAAPGAAHNLVAGTLRKLQQNAMCVEFVGRAMYAVETNDVSGWATLPEVTRRLWRTRAQAAFKAITALSANTAKEALQRLGDPQALADLVQRLTQQKSKK